MTPQPYFRPWSVISGPAIAVILAAVLAACAPKPPAAPPTPRLTLSAVSFADLPGWAGDNQADAVPALARSCGRLKALPADRSTGLNSTVADWREPCAALTALPAGDAAAARRYFETWFRPYRAANNDERTGLFTGYYEAELRGSLQAGGGYRVPLYSRPADLVQIDLGDFREQLKGERLAGRVLDGRLKPYETRAQIEAGALAGRVPVLVWVDDPIEAFFLHIQGSGRVVLDDGRLMRVGFAAQNGHPYVPIARELISRGELTREAATMPGIRAWLAGHPDQVQALFDKNPSYVFFRELTGDGPLGAQGTVLTPGRSLAVDHSFLPYGLPLWLDADDPLDAGRRLQRLLIAQDTGGAIRGPVRGDVFWGHGADAMTRAGVMRSTGGYYALLPRTVTPPS